MVRARNVKQLKLFFPNVTGEVYRIVHSMPDETCGDCKPFGEAARISQTVCVSICRTCGHPIALMTVLQARREGITTQNPALPRSAVHYNSIRLEWLNRMGA